MFYSKCLKIPENVSTKTIKTFKTVIQKNTILEKSGSNYNIKNHENNLKLMILSHKNDLVYFLYFILWKGLFFFFKTDFYLPAWC